MARVRVLPAAIEFECAAGETVMAAAERAGYSWPTLCHGHAICNRCVVVIDDTAAVTPMSAAERVGLEQVRWRDGPRPGERLACQTVPVADITVVKPGVRARSPRDGRPRPR